METIVTILKWIYANRKSLIKASVALCIAFLVSWAVILRKENKQLSESLNEAQNNIEAYQGIINDSQQANNVLRLDIDQLKYQNDSVLQELDKVRKQMKIKSKDVATAATQTQTIIVNDSKGVRGDIVEILKDSIYVDTLSYNPYTTVYYTIGKDTVSIGLDIKNTQYFFVTSKREYKNKKKFIMRLLTLDFKKVTRNTYEIYNTNELVNTSDVRVVENIK